jgi:glutamate racemase
VDFVERGITSGPELLEAAEEYLAPLKAAKVDTVVLGCTHYPLIKKEVEKFYQQKIEIIDSASVVAQYVSDVLKKKDILNTSKRKPKYSFWVSDYTESFEKSTAIFFNQKLKLVEKRIWKDERY